MTEFELVTFELFSVEELELVPFVASELELGEDVAELDSFSAEELDVVSSDADEGSLSQLAQKNAVRARANFFQCL